MATTETPQVDKIIGPDHDRPRVGRHPGAQYPAAEMVGVDVLRDDRFRGHLLDRLSGLAVDDQPTPRGSSAPPTRMRVADDLKAIQAQRAEMEAGLVKASAPNIVAYAKSAKPEEKALYNLALRPRQSGVSPRTARPATARAARAARATATSPTKTGCGAARSTTSSPPSPTASAPTRITTRA